MSDDELYDLFSRVTHKYSNGLGQERATALVRAFYEGDRQVRQASFREAVQAWRDAGYELDEKTRSQLHTLAKELDCLTVPPGAVRYW